jgi:hypothetical protein
MGVTGLLQVAFIVLKLCEVINWSWFWVFFPSIASVLLVILLFVIKIWFKIKLN